MFCMHKHGPKLSEYLFPLVHDFVHAESGQQPWAFVHNFLYDSSTIRKIQEYHFRFGVHCNTEYVKWLADPFSGIPNVCRPSSSILQQLKKKYFLQESDFKIQNGIQTYCVILKLN